MVPAPKIAVRESSLTPVPMREGSERKKEADSLPLYACPLFRCHVSALGSIYHQVVKSWRLGPSLSFGAPHS